MRNDFAQRKMALDITQSFIVEAPAGSGKTSLLVQRYLKLLAIVQNPEEILAITFTKKAAQTMRERILQALAAAQNNQVINDPYEQTTRELALEVLKQNSQHNWQLEHNPKRLRIQTIDAFCNYLVNRAPVVAKHTVHAEIFSDVAANECYKLAATRLLNNYTDAKYSSYLAKVLLHLDNDWCRTEQLLITMLQSRDQWLWHLVGLNSDQELRTTLEQGLQRINCEQVQSCGQLFPQTTTDELYKLLAFAKKHQDEYLQNLDLSISINNFTLEVWQQIATFLLTKEYTWRKQLTKKLGFPAKDSANNTAEKQLLQEMKVRMLNLLNEYSKHETWRQSLEDILNSPPNSYTDQQWEVLVALLHLLPLLVAELNLVWQERGGCDYAEVALAALSALGTGEQPTDLALNLDYRLQHLLIDEFQDTSITQYRLLEKLTASWQPEDNRTLFVVGDPMQSIYRFREAEVGLFLRTQQRGINQVKLQPLFLTQNFRSAATVVNWINDSFPKILPAEPDISSGAVPFHSAVSAYDHADAKVSVQLLETDEAKHESNAVLSAVNVILKDLNDQSSTIAILVKARSHLAEIIPLLQQANLDYQAVELETLQHSAVVKDLLALTRACSHLADRVAWLAILRAPWCGLNLPDLHILANIPETTIWQNVLNYSTLPLSTTAKTQLAKFIAALSPALQHYGRTRIDLLIKQIWLAVGGPATLTNETELADVELFFTLLENRNFDTQLISEQLTTLFKNTANAAARIQVMTIHKAKGLEFDHVIIPGIQRTPRSNAKKLLMWYERPTLNRSADLILAPINSLDIPTDKIYHYLELIEQKKDYYETGRLLYVAITRAKKTVNLIGCVKNSEAITGSGDSLLGQLKNCIESTWIRSVNQTANLDIATSTEPKQFWRLLNNWQNPVHFYLPQLSIEYHWEYHENQDAAIGSAIHKCLCNNSLKASSYWRKLLVQYGCTNIEFGLAKIARAIANILADPDGQWILATHQNAQNEYAITAIIDGEITNVVLDRTFIDQNGVRWIIDYKTTEDSYDPENYRPQLETYGKIMRELDPNHPIKLAIYFTMVPKLIEIKRAI